MDARTVITFDQLARKLGRKLPARDARPSKRSFSNPSSDRSNPRDFPTREDVLHHGLIEAQSPLFTQSPPVEPGDKFEFSSRGLTDWYVGEFCKSNRYRK